MIYKAECPFCKTYTIWESDGKQLKGYCRHLVAVKPKGKSKTEKEVWFEEAKGMPISKVVVKGEKSFSVE